MKHLVVLSGIAAAALISVSGYSFLSNNNSDPTSKSTHEGLVLPSLTAEQTLGERHFGTYCASCHGDFGLGTQNGPPLLHRIYEPNHHGDGAFFRAALMGVRAHHWKFGDMPPVDGITETEIGPIVAYIRVLQKENGVF